MNHCENVGTSVAPLAIRHTNALHQFTQPSRQTLILSDSIQAQLCSCLPTVLSTGTSALYSRPPQRHHLCRPVCVVPSSDQSQPLSSSCLYFSSKSAIYIAIARPHYYLPLSHAFVLGPDLILDSGNSSLITKFTQSERNSNIESITH